MSKPYQDKGTLEQLYLERGLSYREIGEKFGVSESCIGSWVRRYNIGKYQCSYCGENFNKLGNHWQQKPNHRPEITKRQHEILTGLLMSDGTVSREPDKNPRFKCDMTTPKFLKWIDSQMGDLGLGVGVCTTAEEKAKENRESGFSPDAEPEDYQDQYRWNTARHPGLQQYADWYVAPQKKRYPEDLELTPLTLKVWYCGDGHKATEYREEKTSRPSITMGISNEIDRKEFISSLFERKGFSVSFDGEVVALRADEAEKAWDWMGGPLPGFKYKWPTDEEKNQETIFRRWTDEEEEILKENYPARGSDIESLDRTKDSIRSRANDLGIEYKSKDKRNQ